MENNITKGEQLKISDAMFGNRFNVDINNGEDRVLVIEGYSDDNSINKSNAETLISCYNQTYGKSINPECVGEMLEALKGLVLICQHSTEAYIFSKELANGKAAIAKAQL